MLKIGVLGAGHLGKIHIKCIKEIADYELVGFFDKDAIICENVSKEFSLKAFDSIESLIEAVDVIDIVTPTIEHFDCASRALKKSKHVFIEKPIVASVSEAALLINIAQEANVKVQVGHVERFNPAFVQAQAFIDKPMFVEAHRLAQFNPRGTDVPVILDLMIHDIDIVLSVVNSGIRRISASGVSIVSATPDIANARIEFDNGCVANLTASRISMHNMRKVRFFQRNAYISVDLLTKQFEVVSMRDFEGDANPFSMLIDLPDNTKKEIVFNKPDVIPSNAIKSELESFYHAIVDNLLPSVSLNDGYKALEVAHEIIAKINS